MYLARQTGVKRFSAGYLTFAFLLTILLPVSRAFGADLDEAQKTFFKGDYEECIRLANRGMNDSPWEEQWPLLLARSQMAIGKYPEAEATINSALQRYQPGIQVRLLGHDVFNANGHTDRAAQMLKQLAGMLDSLSGGRGARARALGEPGNIVALGKTLLLLNAEPKLILDNFFDQVRRVDPNYREAYLAAGELALEKHDFALASRTFSDTLKKFPDDPDAQFGLARAYAPSDAPRMGKAIEAVLNVNPNHIPAMLLLVDHLVDAEEYTDAQKLLDTVLKVNPWDPEAWAYRAVLAHFKSDTNGETEAREKGLKYWPTNPRVDELIGTKLSQNYRFREGSEHQRQALKFDPDYLPAKIQLAQDLLRLGSETEGWKLAADVHDADGYDVTAYNLITLKQVMSKFKTLTNADFVVRMSATEAPIYGDRVLELLEKAKTTLTQKYGYALDQQTYVEIFAEQKDFGVRTFGMPHNPGFLGVCFGHVVTANSPAAQSGHPENWEAVLWHEFCHVITLGITKNKMPRWLSEGISVYEERQANPIWGENMNPRYREMVLGDDLTPVGELSSAFMNPKTPMHVQFAYYESSLVVEYIVQKYGLDALKKILTDLGNGVNINDALARNTVTLDKLQTDFAAFARDRAQNLAPGLDWKKPTAIAVEQQSGTNAFNLDDVIKRLMRRREAEAAGGTNSGSATNTTAVAIEKKAPAYNYWQLSLEAQQAIAERKWADAKAPLKKLIELYPTQTGSDSAYVLLAAVHRALNETNAERDVLIKLTALESAATEEYLRLMELDASAKDWRGVSENAERFLAVNPLVPAPYRQLARASEELRKADPAIYSYQRLLLLDPPDPAQVHYRLARLLHQKGDETGAKRHVLQALEEAPRYPDALKLLLEIEGTNSSASNDAPEMPFQSNPAERYGDGQMVLPLLGERAGVRANNLNLNFRTE